MIQWRKHGEGARVYVENQWVNTGGSLSRVFFLHVLVGYVKPGLEASQEKPGMNQLISVWFFVFFKCRHDMFGIESLSCYFRIVSWFYWAYESVEFRNLAHQVQRNAIFGSRSNCVIYWFALSLSFGPYFDRPGHFLAWFWWSKFSVVASKSPCVVKIWTWNFFAQRFLADTLQPMLNIQNLRLILPQAPEEENLLRTYIYIYNIYFSSFACLMAYLPHFPTQRTKETLQNQKLQSWFLPINGQWIIDDRVPRSHGEVVLERNHVTLTETTRSLCVLEMKHEKFWEMRDLCKSCQPSCRFPNPSARIFMPWFAGRLQEGSGAYFGMVIILAIWPDSLLLLRKTNTLQLLQPVLVDIFVGTYRSGKPLWEIQMINSSQPGGVRCHPIESSWEVLPRVLAAHYVQPWVFLTPPWEEASFCRVSLEIHLYLDTEYQAFEV